MRHILLTLLFSGGLLAAPAQEPRSERYRFPVRNVAGLYSANFGEMRPNHFHSGVDIKTDGVTGKPVVAAADGYVVRIAVSPGGYGRALYIAHPDGTTTVYGHLERFRTDIESYLRYKRYEQGRSNVDFTCKPSLFPVRAGDTVAPVGQFGHVVRAASPLRGAPQLRPADTQHAGRETAARTRPYRTPHHAAALRRGRLARRRSRPQPSPHLRRGTAAAKGTMRCGRRNPSPVGRRGYFIVECSDRKDEVYNTFGIYRLTEEVDGEVRYEYRMDGFLFGDTRYCNAVSYYPMQLSSRNEVIRLTQPAGCPDRFFTTMKNRALLTTPAGRRQEVRITAEDDCGNRSVLAFTVEGKADERSFHAPACDSLPSSATTATSTARATACGSRFPPERSTNRVSTRSGPTTNRSRRTRRCCSCRAASRSLTCGCRCTATRRCGSTRRRFRPSCAVTRCWPRSRPRGSCATKAANGATDASACAPARWEPFSSWPTPCAPRSAPASRRTT